MNRGMRMRFTVLQFLLCCWDIDVAHSQNCQHNPVRPNGCDFITGHCGWSVTGTSFQDNYYVRNGQRTVRVLNNPTVLQSNKGCHSDSEHCLEFDYKFLLPWQPTDLVLTISVKPWNSRSSIVTASKTSSVDTDWEHFEISFNPHHTDFFIEIHLNSRHGQSGGKVLIDNLNYAESPCSPQTTLNAPAGVGMTSHPRTSSPNFQTIPNIINPFNPSSSIPTAWPQHSTTSTDAARRSASQAPSNSPTHHKADPSDNVGLIVGSVVAVVVLIIACLIVFIFLKRRKVACFRKAFSNVPRDERTQNNGMNDAAARNSGDLERGSIGTAGGSPSSQLPPGDFYGVEELPDSSPSGQSAEYAKVNQPSVEYATVNKQRGKRNVSEKNPYENDDDHAEDPQSNSLPDVDKTANFVKPVTEIKPAQDSKSLKSAYDDEYNVLNFESNKMPKKSVSENCEINEVYSHLNEGDDGTYNEVHRDRKTQVIDDDYSHVRQ